MKSALASHPSTPQEGGSQRYSLSVVCRRYWKQKRTIVNNKILWCGFIIKFISGFLPLIFLIGKNHGTKLGESFYSAPKTGEWRRIPIHGILNVGAFYSFPFGFRILINWPPRWENANKTKQESEPNSKLFFVSLFCCFSRTAMLGLSWL